MPDWLSHVLFALILCLVFGMKRKSFVLVGAIIPDLVGKWQNVMLLFNFDLSEAYKLLFPFHTPLGSILVLGIIGLAVNRADVFSLGLLGVASHFFLDSLTYHTMFGQSLLFFPFSWRNFEIGIVGIDGWYYVLIALSVTYLVLCVLRLLRPKAF
ncbi:MAG: metal-dependent hydrolase [Candidatus Woesearchaeota archaeon]